MKHLNASAFQRLVAYLLDFFIVTTVADLILNLIGGFIPGYDPDLLISKYEIFMEQVSMNMDINYELVSQIMTLALAQLLWTFVVMIPIVVLYFCVLGHYWKRQTVGRSLMGLRLVNNDEEESKVSFPKLLLRELVGSFLITYTLSTSFLIPVIILIYLAVSKRMVFADYIAKTKLIDLKIVVVKRDNVEEFRSQFSNNDFVDAEFKDVKYNEDNQSQNEAINDSDEEYRIF